MVKQSLKKNLEQAEEVGTAVPGYSQELGERIESMINDIGSLKEAAKIVDCTSEQLAKWRDGRAKMPFYAAVLLAEAVKKPVDWIATGQRFIFPENNIPLIEAELEETIRGLENHLRKNNKVLSPAEKARMICTLYTIKMEEMSK